MNRRHFPGLLVVILGILAWGRAAQAFCPTACPTSDVFQIVDKTTGTPLIDLVTGQPTAATLFESPIQPETSVTFTVPIIAPFALTGPIALTEEPAIFGIPHHASDFLTPSLVTLPFGGTALQLIFHSDNGGIPPLVNCSSNLCIQETGQLQDLTSILLSGGTGQTWLVQVQSDVETTDTDGDGIPDNVDNCPFVPNGPSLGTCLGNTAQGQATCHVNGDCTSGMCSLAQEDTGGIGSGSPPDGIGDACQCGDADNNGIVDNNDATFIKRAVAAIAPYPGGVTTLPGYNKCQVVNGAPGLTCNNTQATIIQRAVAGLAPGIVQGCHAATIFP